jgi:hypothetical protein
MIFPIIYRIGRLIFITGILTGRKGLIRKVISGVKIVDTIGRRKTIIIFSGRLKIHNYNPPGMRRL